MLTEYSTPFQERHRHKLILTLNGNAQPKKLNLTENNIIALLYLSRTFHYYFKFYSTRFCVDIEQQT